MSTATVFWTHLVLGYVAWLLLWSAYVWPKLKTMDWVESQRAIAALHSFRFFGLVFLLSGVIGPNLPASFAQFAAYGDFATGVLAILALLTVRMRPVFSLLVIAFNVVGATDILIDYFHGNQGWPRHDRRATGRHLLDSDPLCATADDYAHCGFLSAAASSAPNGPDIER